MEGDDATWYYQCYAEAVDSFGRTYESDFRFEVRDWVDITWPGLGARRNKIRSLTPGSRPLPGDVLLVGFAKSGAQRPGMLAVGLVVDEREDAIFRWRPLSPTGSLMLRPLWDADVEKRLNAVRGGTKTLTCWELSRQDADYLLSRASRWANTGV